jgi:chaperonin GroEL
MKGISLLADTVISTLGPNGRNVVYTNQFGEPSSTKDGVSVAKSISLEDPTQDLGAQLLKQAAIKTGERAGDGTTTSTLLAYEMVKTSLKHLNNGENAVQIKRDMDQAVKKVVDNLRKNISEKISNEEQLKQIATISSNNDTETGTLISSAISKVGVEGVVYIEESKSDDTYLEFVEGMQFDRGYKSPYFVTNNDNMTCVLENPLILILDGKLSKINQMLPILESVSSQSRSLLIIADDIEQEALATLLVNKMRGIMNVCAVKAPDFGDRRKLILEDIAISTGGTVFSPEKGMKLEKYSWDWFGEARTVTIGKEQTTIVDGKGKEDLIENRIKELQIQVDKSSSAFETEKLQERLAKFIGGVAIIYVGGNTETEMKEKKDRVDDALNATKAAIEEGIIPGGGSALLHARKCIKDLTSIGGKIVYESCGKPFEQILINAGFSKLEAYIEGYKLTDESNGKSKYNSWLGYDIKEEKIVNMKESGIIDPTKVARTAIENAVSVAGTILLTECTIVDSPKDKKPTQNGVDLSQFGM